MSNFEDNPREDQFWSNDPSILYRVDRMIEFFPTTDMTDLEKLNAIARFSIYTSIMLLIYYGDTWPLYIAVIGLGATLFMSKSIEVETHPEQELKNRQIAERRMNDEFYPLDQPINSEEDLDFANPPIQNYEQRLRNTIKKAHFDRYERGQPREIKMDGQYCTAPTRDNPFMNITVNQYGDNPVRPPACDPQKVAPEIDHHFNYDLYKDVGDVFGKENFQRQFYTMPSTTNPNDQGDFAKWLYGTPIGSTYKESGRGPIQTRGTDNFVRSQSRNSGFDPAKIIKTSFP